MKKPRGYDGGNAAGNGLSWTPGVNNLAAGVNYSTGSNPNPNPNPNPGPGINNYIPNPNPNPNQGVNEVVPSMGSSFPPATAGPYMGGPGSYENNGGDFVGGAFQQQNQGYNGNGDMECRRYNTPDGCPYGVNCRFKHGPTDDRELGHQMPPSGNKTKPCMKFFSTSGCPYGESCHFLHYVPGGITALGLAPVQTMPNNVMPPPRKQPGPSADPSVTVNGYKTRLCNRFNTPEGCRFGDKCHFAHGESDLRAPNNLRQPNRSMTSEVPMQSAPVMYNNGPPATYPNSAGYGDTTGYANSATYSANTFSNTQTYGEPTPPGVVANTAFVPNYNMSVDNSSQFAGTEGTVPAGSINGNNVQVY